jgi:hypothetical protein
MLPIAAATSTCMRVGTRRRNSTVCGLNDLNSVSAKKLCARSNFGDLNNNALSGNRVTHEDDLAVVARHTVTAVRHRPNIDSDVVAN